MQMASVHVSDYVCGPHRLISEASKTWCTFFFTGYLELKLEPHPYQL